MLCCAAVHFSGLCCACAGEHVVVPLLCLSGAVPCPAGENGPSSGRIMVNLDLTNAQPAPGVMTATHNVSLSIPPARRTCRGYVHRNRALRARVGVAVTWLNLIDLHALLCLRAPTPCMMHSTHASSRLTPCRFFVEKILLLMLMPLCLRRWRCSSGGHSVV